MPPKGSPKQDVKPKKGIKKKQTDAQPIHESKIEYLKEALENSFQVRFKNKVSPKHWIMPNRVKFPNWIDVTFKYSPLSKKSSKQQADTKQTCDCENDSTKCVSKVQALHLFPHQQFIADYIQFSSPYRGVLLYHSLGSGKSATSIAAAEILANNMNVIAMTPASLSSNFVEEIKKYGRHYYAVAQKWLYVPLNSKDNKAVEELAEMASIPISIIKKNKGIYVPHKTSPDAQMFNDLSEEAKIEVQEQIEASIKKRFTFIHYNGLNRKKIEELTDSGKTNPFDNSCVVIDEIHNLISRVVNNREIGKAVYKLLHMAKNCKLILLSGTPVINYPHEIAYIVNMITGPRKMYELSLRKGADPNILKEILDKSIYIDRYNIEPNVQRVSFDFLPEGFIFHPKPNVVRTNEDIKTHDDILSIILKQIKDSGIEVVRKPQIKLGETLPTDEEDFNKYFIDFNVPKFMNDDIFMKRILGTVSFYETFNPELFPTTTIEHVITPLTDYQFSVYEKSRGEERRKELQSKQNKKKETNVFNSSGQVYRFYSRANCNFVFPETIKRPFPTGMSSMKNEMDLTSEEDESLVLKGKDENSDDQPKMKSKKDFTLEYQKNLTNALSELDKNRDQYLTIDKLKTLYSPKFAKVVQKLQACPGTALIYSQFRTVEGLGILGMALKAVGWAEFKIKKSGDIWVLDVAEEDLDKPMYGMFTGNNEESKILLKVFNGDFDVVPESIRARLQSTTNLHGEIFKAIMITQSGAEGLSLKNVRQVHVLEPYWNHIRINQVIGRAVRTCSHLALSPDERNVTVYQYRTSFSKKQLENSFTLRTQDKSMTTDEYIHDIAERKFNIIKTMLEYVQKASIDCALNAQFHKNIKCFSFPLVMNQENITHEFELTRDKPFSGLIKKEWTGQVLLTKKGNFLLDPATNTVYDYDIYLYAGKLVKLGVLELLEDGKTRRISISS